MGLAGAGVADQQEARAASHRKFAGERFDSGHYTGQLAHADGVVAGKNEIVEGSVAVERWDLRVLFDAPGAVREQAITALRRRDFIALDDFPPRASAFGAHGFR